MTQHVHGLSVRGPGLPTAESEEDFDELTDEDLRPGVEALCRDLGADVSGLTRYPTGSLPVFAAGPVVLKLFPPAYADEYPVEAGVLAAVRGRLPIPTPAVHAVGERDGWGYVLMDRMPGEPLDAVWDAIDAGGRDRLATQLGEAMAALHAVPPPAIDAWWPEDWDEFVAQQRAVCVARHQGLGLARPWLDQVRPFLDSVDLLPGPPVLLHTEIMRQHLLVARQGGGWTFTGLFDFEPAMRGAPEYEFVALGVHTARGDARFLGRALRAYGHRPLDEAFRRRLTAWTLLHYYSNMREYLDRLPEADEPTFESLSDRWYATD